MHLSYHYRILIPAVAFLFIPLLACNRSEATRESETEHGHEHGGGTAVTVWTDSTELFFEYPALIASKPSDPWVVHVTRLRDFDPVASGSLTLVFNDSTGQVTRYKTDQPARPGIFSPTPTLPAAGSYDLVVEITGPMLTDRIPVGTIQVFATEAELRHEEETQTGSAISFLKEQQWAADFMVAATMERTLPVTVEADGELVPASGRAAQVAAPASGLLLAGANQRAPGAGESVRQGQTLAILSPTGGDNSFAATKSRLESLKREVARSERLYAVEAIPERRLIEARHELAVAEAALNAMGGGSAEGYNYVVRAPISGTIGERFIMPGARVEAGDPLFTIVNSGVVWLKLRVPARYAGQSSDATAAAFTVEGSDRIYYARTVVATSDLIDPESRTLPVTLAVENDGTLKIGMFARGRLFIGGNQRGVAVPNESLLKDDGASVVFVQTGGESFERRTIQPGPSDGTFTIILNGLKAGEHIVTQGAYQVHLASLNKNAISDHGHPH